MGHGRTQKDQTNSKCIDNYCCSLLYTPAIEFDSPAPQSQPAPRSMHQVCRWKGLNHFTGRTCRLDYDCEPVYDVSGKSMEIRCIEGV